MAGSDEDRSFGGVLGGESGVVALDGSAGRSDCGCAEGKMQRHVRFDLEGCAKFDGRGCSACSGLCGEIGQAKLRKQGGDAHRLLRPIHQFGLGDFVIECERLTRGVRIGGGDASHLAPEAVGNREKLGEFLPFFFGRLMKGDA